MLENNYDEPKERDIDDDDVAEAVMADAAFHRAYENEHTWEALQEDEQGLLRVDRTAEQRARRQRALAAAAKQGTVRKGMIRYLLLVIDLSAASSANDLRPSRLSCMISAAKDFVRSFFDQNPLSQLAILAMRNGVCVRLTELSSSPEAQLRKLEASAINADGSASLQNTLDMGIALLKHIPPYGHREMLVMFSSLATCDPGNIFDSIKTAKAAKIRVSVVGIAAEVHVCRRMTEETLGTYGIALHESHLQELMSAHAPPPSLLAGTSGAELVNMGFPQRGSDQAANTAFVGPTGMLLSGSYACPRCKARVAELPSECHVCNLTLISSPHLARSYHHLFPVMPYEELTNTQLSEVPELLELQASEPEQSRQQLLTTTDGTSIRIGAEVPGELYCFGCMKDLTGFVHQAQQPRKGKGTGSMVLRCGTCQHVFCFDCDLYVHESLHNCPGCELSSYGAA